MKRLLSQIQKSGSVELVRGILLAMKIISLTLVLLLAALQSSYGQTHPATAQENLATASALPNGNYMGLQKMESPTPQDKKTKWFYENTLLIRNGEAILDMVPFSIKKGKKEYSASDGGFMTFRGRFFHKGSQLYVSMRLFKSDYIGFPVGGCEPYSRINISIVKFVQDKIEIQGVLYEPKQLDKKVLEQLQLALSKEPMEYTGEHPYNQKYLSVPCQ
jgi:hypothetical protein